MGTPSRAEATNKEIKYGNVRGWGASSGEPLLARATAGLVSWTRFVARRGEWA